MSLSIIHDPQHWRSPTEEARTIAEQLNDPQSKETTERQDGDSVSGFLMLRQKQVSTVEYWLLEIGHWLLGPEVAPEVALRSLQGRSLQGALGIQWNSEICIS